jgi:hypothetical protein
MLDKVRYLEDSNTLAYFVGASLEKIRSILAFVPVEARAVSTLRFHSSMVAAYGVTVGLTFPEI